MSAAVRRLLRRLVWRVQTGCYVNERLEWFNEYELKIYKLPIRLFEDGRVRLNWRFGLWRTVRIPSAVGAWIYGGKG